MKNRTVQRPLADRVEVVKNTSVDSEFFLSDLSIQYTLTVMYCIRTIWSFGTG